MTKVHVLIERNGGVRIPRLVPDYEVPVLQEIHGEAMVSIVSSVETKDSVDPVEAHEALIRRYGDEAVRPVYRTPQSLERELRPARRQKREAEAEIAA